MSTTLKDLEDVIIKMASEFPDPMIEALLVHEDDLDKIEQILEETEKTHPNTSAFFDCLYGGIRVYKWDGSVWLLQKFKGIPEPGEPIASYSNVLQCMAKKIKKRRDGGTG